MNIEGHFDYRSTPSHEIKHFQNFKRPPESEDLKNVKTFLKPT